MRFSFLLLIIFFSVFLFSSPAWASCTSNEQCPPGTECDMSMGNWGVCSPSQTTDPCSGVSCNPYCQSGTYYPQGNCVSDASKSAGYRCDYLGSVCPSGECSEPNSSGVSYSCKEVSVPAPIPEPAPNPVPVQIPAKEVKGFIYFIDEKSNVIPLPFAKIVFEYDDASGNHFEDSSHFTWTGKDGKFYWSNSTVFASGNKIDVLISFEDEFGKLKIITDNSKMFYLQRNIPSEDKIWSNFEKELSVWDQKGLAKIYINTGKAVDFAEKVLKISPTELENVRAFSANGTYHVAEIYSAQHPNDVGITIKSNKSYFETRDAPTNREFHEYCHHIQDTVLREKRIPAGIDHGGYFVNPDSEFGLIEGWAEFCALEMKRYYKIKKPWIYEYSSTETNIELNHIMDSNTEKKLGEEFSIAGILLDLRDSVNDYGGTDDDFVSLPLSDIWEAFSEKRDFNDGNGIRGVYSLYDFYVSLKEVTKGNKGIHDIPAADSVSNFDRVFILHHAFQDDNNNDKWDKGEKAGLSGKGSIERKNVEPEPGTDLVFDIKSFSGSLLTTSLLAEVDVKLDAPNNYLSYNYTVPVLENKINLPVIPEGYSGTITVTALQGGTEQRAEESFAITASEIREKLNPLQPIGIYSSELELTPFSCSHTSECEFWNAGNECNSSGSCHSITLPDGTGKLEAGENNYYPDYDIPQNCEETYECGAGLECKDGQCTKVIIEPVPPEEDMIIIIIGLVTILLFVIIVLLGIFFIAKKVFKKNK